MLKMLVPVDGSASSDRAVDHLIRKSSRFKDPVEIHLLTVQPPIVSGNVRMFISHEQINEYYQEEGLKALKPARDKLDAAGLKYVFQIGLGDPAEVIARYAREKACDQIFMGTRGMGSISNLLLGSVATKVIHFADVPVVLVK